MTEVIPNIGFQTEWTVLEQLMRAVIPFSQWVQVDFSDGTWIPNKTLMDFSMFSGVSKEVSLEAHLMVSQPEKYIKAVADAGFKRIIAHVEAQDPRLFFEQAQYEEVEVGIALDGPTDFEQVEPFLEEVDEVLVMTTEAGGSNFLSESVEKIRTLHLYLPDLTIAAEGGMAPDTVKIVKDAGATRIVTNSYIFKDLTHIKEAIDHLKEV